MQCDNLFDEGALGPGDILDSLSRHGIRHEPDEIAGMAGFHRDADLAVRLETADARTMAGAWIDNNEGTTCEIDLHTTRRLDAYQSVIHRPRQVSAVRDQFDLVIEDMGDCFSQVLAVLL